MYSNLKRVRKRLTMSSWKKFIQTPIVFTDVCINNWKLIIYKHIFPFNC